jgi:hypothetical protein
MKLCARCSSLLPISSFYRRRHSPDGLQSWCKLCTKQANSENYRRHRGEPVARKPSANAAYHIVDEGHKACRTCRRRLPVEAFYKNTRHSNGLFLDCKACWKALPSQSREARTGAARRAKYGVSEQQYSSMLAAQGGRCALCDGEPTARGLFVDHDHSTGAVRELLCHHCNVGLGHFADSAARLSRAVDYLKKHQNTASVPAQAARKDVDPSG